MSEELKTDRTGWGAGPWDSEPDKVVWVDEATNLDCMAKRNHMGAWCGYVGVPEGHPAFQQPYDDVHVDTHGGLTYANHCSGSICHDALPGRPHEVWWLGFDCNHGGDFAPYSNKYVGDPVLGKYYPQPYDHKKALLGAKNHPDAPFLVDIYRPLRYAQDQVTELAKQLKEMESG